MYTTGSLQTKMKQLDVFQTYNIKFQLSFQHRLESSLKSHPATQENCDESSFPYPLKKNFICTIDIFWFIVILSQRNKLVLFHLFHLQIQHLNKCPLNNCPIEKVKNQKGAWVLNRRLTILQFGSSQCTVAYLLWNQMNII